MLAETSVLTPKGTKTLFYMWYVFLVESAKRRQRNDLAIDLNQGERRRRTVPERGDWRSSAQGELLLRRDRPLSVEKGITLKAMRFAHGMLSRSNFNPIALRPGKPRNLSHETV
jgi:hypothetical protein